MTTSGPGEPDGTPSVPDHVWRKFLEDDEHAIRASAPREPAARERTSGWRPGPPPDVVGEPWDPEDPWAGPVWRELDGRARIRRVGRVIGTAAAVALALTAWSQLSTGPGTPGGGPADTIGQHLEESPVLPTVASLAPTASGDASPAAFEPDPSAAPRMSASPWTID
ncbi:hypothetical protein [Streptomyces pactum]|uniref:Uncharacterized protein n=1 Tax=Streptomyces pactum TaxID=68249 RepID=A0A1S6J715_9ACTN|nr:hypothetical protein [Streptomyces pactum]AQS67558.1 hypothetical protein B1H29_12065 [Streptomyces pactum]